jgi:hypothetical protein
MIPPSATAQQPNNGKHTEYQLISAPGKQPVRFSFIGHLLGAPTTWEATLWTSSAYPLSNPCPSGHNQFMEIGDTQKGITPITIVLNLSEIDGGAILKTLIMVRKYKKLRPGLICFGG